ncbi:pitrilysin family protein [Chryseobacterium tructae]|uniref:M16 family metallopeptidase n=1 Tax=Chryseobacterium tructae TaxID=1037380 RepID=A0ABV7XVZ0_9FLAO|nr:pitrilysin family protein [Chryseobacterium tructae]MDN3692510.1 pitrilysin family protein [Chryseobacterium tructae]
MKSLKFKKTLLTTAIFVSGICLSQQIKFKEYDLPNGLHVILHQDNTVPVVTTAVMYYVGAKDEVKGKTGFAHFFEHLLFEGTNNIKKGDWFKIVLSNGGRNNANTNYDRTYYYETFPSNNEQLGLWMEAERMRHAVIDQTGVNTQRNVVKEEKKERIDNVPYGGNAYLTAVNPHIFNRHPYSGSIIGSIEDLNSAQLDEFKTFYKKYYVPNNATLVVAGDIKPEQTKKWIQQYYGSIPKGIVTPKNLPAEEPIVQEKEVTETDQNIELPAYIFAYRIPGNKEKDSYILKMLASYLGSGPSSVLQNKLANKDKKVLDLSVGLLSMEDYGVFKIFAIPRGDVKKQILKEDIDAEIKKLQTTLISQEEYQKLQNEFESYFVKQNSNIEKITESLATNYVLKGNTNLINKEIDIYKSVTREDLQQAAIKYLNPNQRVVINYLPATK